MSQAPGGAPLPREVVLATHNAKKLVELRRLLDWEALITVVVLLGPELLPFSYEETDWDNIAIAPSARSRTWPMR